MIEIGTALPNLELCDINGRVGSADDLATTGIPVLIVTSAMSRLCRDLESVYLEFAKLDEGDYQVWALVEGPRVAVEAAFSDLAKRIRVFPFERGRDGLEALGIERYPALVVSTIDNEVSAATEGWDRTEWQSQLRDLRAILGWQPVFLPRTLPGPSATLVTDDHNDLDDDAPIVVGAT